MKSGFVSRGFALVVCASAMVIGACGGDSQDNLPPAEVGTKESIDEAAKKIDMGRTGYKGAPGGPVPK